MIKLKTIFQVQKLTIKDTKQFKKFNSKRCGYGKQNKVFIRFGKPQSKKRLIWLIIHAQT
jgi:hypothetical protein